MYTERLTDPSTKHSVVADVGGSIVTGIDGNPLSVVVKQLQMPLSHIRDRTPLYMPDGSLADFNLDSAVESFYNDVLMIGCDGVRKNPEEVKNMSLLGALEKLWDDNYTELEKMLPQGPSGGAPLQDRKGQLPEVEHAARAARQMFEWHLANLEFANACRLEDCSLLHWDQDDPNELPGPHCFVPGCNGRWLRALCENVAVEYNKLVSEIRYAKSGVAVTTPGKVFHADAVVVTIPLGVLKRGGVAFTPPLPERKQAAIARLGFGNLNKVILMFPKVFWSEDEDMFGHVSKDPATRGEAFLFYSYARISGGAQLTALVAGAAADEQEKRPAADSAARVMSVLRNIFEPQGIEVPAPLQVLVTRWGSDCMAYGAYSSMSVSGQGGKDYDILAENIGGRVFFAGEATTKRYPATMHGAFYTGLWTAGEIDAALCKGKEMPQAGSAEAAVAIRDIESANAAKEAAVAAAHAAARREKSTPAKKPETVALGNGNVTAAAAGGSGGAGVQPVVLVSPMSPRVVPLLRPEHAQCIANKVSKLSKLKMLFDDHLNPPDIDVHGFKVVFGAPGSAVAHQGLLRIDMTFLRGPGRQGRNQYSASGDSASMNIYCLLLKDHALALAGLPDNFHRMNMLTCLPGAKYLDREELPEDAMKILESVMRRRRQAVTPAAWPDSSRQRQQEKQIGAAGPKSQSTFPAVGGGPAPRPATNAAYRPSLPPQSVVMHAGASGRPRMPPPPPRISNHISNPPSHLLPRAPISASATGANDAAAAPTLGYASAPEWNNLNENSAFSVAPQRPQQQQQQRQTGPSSMAAAAHQNVPHSQPVPAAPAASFSTASLVLGIAASAVSGDLDTNSMRG